MYNLNRFLEAQEKNYGTALSEIRSGQKRSHWIWYIFPQARGLGFSYTSEFYGIDGLAEAKAYIGNRLLRERLVEASEALLALEQSDAGYVMGYPDDLKLRSSMTLFAEAVPEMDVFQRVLDKFFGGEKDQKTLDLLASFLT